MEFANSRLSNHQAPWLPSAVTLQNGFNDEMSPLILMKLISNEEALPTRYPLQNSAAIATSASVNSRYRLPLGISRPLC